MIAKVGGGGLCWRRWGKMMDALPEAQWLAESLEAARYVVIVVLDLFSGRGATRYYYFA